jgi:dTDP-4-amino-4,6-dideoxygalactose transaminase
LQACEIDIILSIPKNYILFLIEDNAQTHNVTFKLQITGSFENPNSTSFLYEKTLG